MAGGISSRLDRDGGGGGGSSMDMRVAEYSLNANFNSII